jgi:hypothetical protein
VRVVGLSAACGSVQAGAGPAKDESVRQEALHTKQQLVVDKREENSNEARARGAGLRAGDQTGVESVCGRREVASWVGG